MKTTTTSAGVAVGIGRMSRFPRKRKKRPRTSSVSSRGKRIPGSAGCVAGYSRAQIPPAGAAAAKERMSRKTGDQGKKFYLKIILDFFIKFDYILASP